MQKNELNQMKILYRRLAYRDADYNGSDMSSERLTPNYQQKHWKNRKGEYWIDGVKVDIWQRYTMTAECSDSNSFTRPNRRQTAGVDRRITEARVMKVVHHPFLAVIWHLRH